MLLQGPAALPSTATALKHPISSSLPKAFEAPSPWLMPRLLLLQADLGHLYPLERAFFYINKPPLLITHEEIEGVEFQRQGNDSLAVAKTFDLLFRLKVRMLPDVCSLVPWGPPLLHQPATGPALRGLGYRGVKPGLGVRWFGSAEQEGQTQREGRGRGR